MPDFTEVVHYHCASVESFQTEVKGSKGQVYHVGITYQDHPDAAQYDWDCTCKGFSFRRSCKHVTEAKLSKAYCGWHQMVDGGDPVEMLHGDPLCPRCSGKTIPLRYAV